MLTSPLSGAWKLGPHEEEGEEEREKNTHTVLRITSITCFDLHMQISFFFFLFVGGMRLCSSEPSFTHCALLPPPIPGIPFFSAPTDYYEKLLSPLRISSPAFPPPNSAFQPRASTMSVTCDAQTLFLYLSPPSPHPKKKECFRDPDGYWRTEWHIWDISEVFRG